MTRIPIKEHSCNGKYPRLFVLAVRMSLVWWMGGCGLDWRWTKRLWQILVPRLNSHQSPTCAFAEPLANYFGWHRWDTDDIKLFLSLVGSQQATPMAGTEATIRALLRYLVGNSKCGLCRPLVEKPWQWTCLTRAILPLHTGAVLICRGWSAWTYWLTCCAFSDASHAPYRFNGRRSYTSACREIHKHPCKRWGGGGASRQIWQRLKLRLTNGLGLV